MMFGVEFKIASTNTEKNTHVIRVQQSGALRVPPGGTSKLHSQDAHRQEGGNGPGELRDEVCALIPLGGAKGRPY